MAKQLNSLSNQRWSVLLWHTLLALLMMQACRIIYFWYNRSYFPTVDLSTFLELMNGGFRLDARMIIYGFFLYYLLMVIGIFLPARVELSRGYRSLRHIGYLVPYALFLFLNLSDTGYYPFVLRRVDNGVFSEFQGKSMFSFYTDFVVQFWPLTLTFVVLMALGVWGYFGVQLKRDTFSKPTARYKISWVLGVVALLFIGVRGTFAHIDTTKEDRQVFKKQSFVELLRAIKMNVQPSGLDLIQPFVKNFRHIPIAYNTPYTIIHRMTTRQEFNFFPTEELKDHFTPFYYASPICEGDSLFGSIAGRNVVVIIMESMAKEYIGYLNREIPGYKGYTPFLDSIMPNSLHAKYGFSSGKRSVEVFPSIFASIPSFGGTFNDDGWNMDNYQHFKTFDTGLPRSLGEKGYDLKFYHGDKKGALGFYAFLQGLYKERELKEYTKDEWLSDHPNADKSYINTWGVHDKPFLQTFAQDIASLQEPFGAFLFTLSNHSPFELPQDCVSLYEEGALPIHRTTAYSDDALRDFFAIAKQQPWYQNTLFVITGDHTSLSNQPTYQNTAGHAAVPLLFFDPQGHLKGEISEYVVQHTDILPTLLYLLGITDPILTYGHNMFDPDAPHYALNYFQDQFIYLSKEVTVTMSPSGDLQVEAPSAYLQTEPSSVGLPAKEIQEKHANRLKAIAQDYNHRVLYTSFSLRDVYPDK